MAAKENCGCAWLSDAERSSAQHPATATITFFRNGSFFIVGFWVIEKCFIPLLQTKIRRKVTANHRVSMYQITGSEFRKLKANPGNERIEPRRFLSVDGRA